MAWTWVLFFVLPFPFFWVHCLMEFTKASLVFFLGKKPTDKRAKKSSHDQRRKKYKVKRLKHGGS